MMSVDLKRLIEDARAREHQLKIATAWLNNNEPPPPMSERH
jgi:hypothetical protein